MYIMSWSSVLYPEPMTQFVSESVMVTADCRGRQHSSCFCVHCPVSTTSGAKLRARERLTRDTKQRGEFSKERRDSDERAEIEKAVWLASEWVPCDSESLCVCKTQIVEKLVAEGASGAGDCTGVDTAPGIEWAIECLELSPSLLCRDPAARNIGWPYLLFLVPSCDSWPSKLARIQIQPVWTNQPKLKLD